MATGSESILLLAGRTQTTVHHHLHEADVPPLYVPNWGTPEGGTRFLLWPGLEETVHPAGLRAKRNFFEEETLLVVSHLQTIDVRVDTVP